MGNFGVSNVQGLTVSAAPEEGVKVPVTSAPESAHIAALGV